MLSVGVAPSLADLEALGRILLWLDMQIDILDTQVFEAAYVFNQRSLEEQLRHAQSDSFLPPVKEERDRTMSLRNQVAQLLGFNRRIAHDRNDRDYANRRQGDRIVFA